MTTQSERRDDTLHRIEVTLRDSGTLSLSQRSDIQCAFGIFYDALTQSRETGGEEGDVPEDWHRIRVFKGDSRHKEYLEARFPKDGPHTAPFMFEGHRWQYQHTSWNDMGEYDLLVRPPDDPKSPPLAAPSADDGEIRERVADLISQNIWNCDSNSCSPEHQASMNSTAFRLLALLKAEGWGKKRVPLSDEAKAARTPRPPASRISDPREIEHQDAGPSRVAKSVRARQKPPLG